MLDVKAGTTSSQRLCGPGVSLTRRVEVKFGTERVSQIWYAKESPALADPYLKGTRLRRAMRWNEVLVSDSVYGHSNCLPRGNNHYY
jgi:hypothetical protein